MLRSFVQVSGLRRLFCGASLVAALLALSPNTASAIGPGVATITTVQTSGTPSNVGQPVTFSATIKEDPGGANVPGPGNVTFDFGDGTSVNDSVVNGAASATHTFTAAGTYTVTASYGGGPSHNASVSPSITQQVNSSSATTALIETSNLTQFVNVPVTFTVTGTSTPVVPLTYTINYGDGTPVTTSAPLTSGVPVTPAHTYTVAGVYTVLLTVSNGTITATDSITETIVEPNSGGIGVPNVSKDIQKTQVGGAIVATSSAGGVIQLAINMDALMDDGPGTSVTPSGNGFRMNFSGEPEQPSTVERRASDAFAALGYARRGDPIYKAPTIQRQPKEWQLWGQFNTSNINSSPQSSSLRGGHLMMLAGLTRFLTPNSLVGVFGGYENYDYSSTPLNSNLRGNGLTIGGYFGWRPLSNVRLDAGIARSGLSNDIQAGTATASFRGERWIGTAGLTGSYDAGRGFVVEPSAKVFVARLDERAFIDSVGTQHADHGLTSGRASFGAKVSYTWLWSATQKIVPYVGLYADTYFLSDQTVLLAGVTALPTPALHGSSARLVSGVSVLFTGGARLSFGGELGGIGNDYRVWTFRGLAAVPF